MKKLQKPKATVSQVSETPNTPPNAPPPTDTETPVVAESYDEVVFTNPTEPFWEQLQTVSRLPALQYSQQDHFPRYADTDDAQALLEAQKFLQGQLATVQARMQAVNAELQATDEAIRHATERNKATSSSANNSVATATARSNTASSSTNKSAAAPGKAGGNKKN